MTTFPRIALGASLLAFTAILVAPIRATVAASPGRGALPVDCDDFLGFDVDEDGICGIDDNCRTVANPDQTDTDRDGVGDACDPCVGIGPDPDGDELCGIHDNCANVANPGQENADGDSFGDACDTCEGDGSADHDGDGICDEPDVCPDVADPDQFDRDRDGIGDACDGCPALYFTPNYTDDEDGDGRPDICDACHGDPTDACARALVCTTHGAILRVGIDGGSFVGWTGLDGCRGLAVEPGTGTLYALTYGGIPGRHILATIDPTTGLGTPIAAVEGFPLETGIAFGADGTLFGLDGANGVLRTIDRTTGATAAVGATGVAHRDHYGLASDGATGLTLAGDAGLFALDPSSAAATPGPAFHFHVSCFGNEELQALTRDGPTLYGLQRCDQWSYLVGVDPGTGSVVGASKRLPLSEAVAVTADLSAGEICDNCADDDGDGLVDFEDPACCAGEAAALDVARVLLAPRADGTSAVSLSGRLPAESLPPATEPQRSFHLQLHAPAGGGRFCAAVPSDAFRRRPPRRDVVFSERVGVTPSAGGLYDVKLRDDRSNVRLALRGRQVALFTPVSGPLRVTLGLRAHGAPPATARCATATVTLRPRGATAVRFP